MVLPAPLKPRTTTLEPLSMAEVNTGEDLERTVHLGQAGRIERGLAAGGRFRKEILAYLSS